MKGFFGKKSSEIQSIEVEQKHLTLRMVLFVIFLVLGIAALIYGLSGFFTEQTGWRAVEREQAAEADCSDEFILQYDIGHAGISAKTEYNRIAKLYGEITAKAYQLFNETELFEGVNNVAYLNQHPNESVVVDEALYNALEKLEKAECRQCFAAPMEEYYKVLFTCSEDWEAAGYDPDQNEELAELYKNTAKYINDEGSISISLSDGNKACLKVSQEYLDFAEENDIFTLFSFGFMKNAFIADYMAEELVKGGYTNGALSSSDGFTRDLDSRGTVFSLNLFDRVGNAVYCTGTLNYSEPMSIAAFRTFPVNPTDNGKYYVMKDGTSLFPYINIKDGKCLAAESNLVCCSKSKGCAELVLQAVPCYISEELDIEGLVGDKSVDIIYCKNNTIFCSWKKADITDILQADDIAYTVKEIK